MPVMLKRGKRTFPYTTVQERLDLAHGPGTELPTGIQSITTQIVSTSEGEGAPFIIALTTLTFTDGQSFCGAAEITTRNAPQTQSGIPSIQETNPVECAQTKALGRALALAGYLGSDAELGEPLEGYEEPPSSPRTSPRTSPRATTAPPKPPQPDVPDHQITMKEADPFYEEPGPPSRPTARASTAQPAPPNDVRQRQTAAQTPSPIRCAVCKALLHPDIAQQIGGQWYCPQHISTVAR